jgi:two-component system chemotaxis response regulator CheB/chemosensory pili system protein ChpB (putative protein-glutamate methylesterase)
VPDIRANTTGAVPVALLYEAGDPGGHLKDALNELGAAIVYEALASNLDRAALAGSGARIVVFNLDSGSDSHIDDVYDVLDQGGYEVVFNDADASARLSGSDQARWARHLAAKILHKPEMAEPPRPAWAESVPRPEQKPASQIVSIQSAASEIPEPQLVPMEAAAEPDAIVEPALPVISPEPTLELTLLDDFVLTESDVDVRVPSAAPPPEPESTADAESSFAAALEDFAAHVPAHQHGKATDDIAHDLDALFADKSRIQNRGSDAPDLPKPAARDAEPRVGEHIEMAEFPAIFDQLDAVPEAGDTRFSYKPAPLSQPPAPPEVAPAEPLLPPDWSLEPLDENTVVTPPAGKASAFGIETMSASDYLAPDDDEPAAPPPISEGLSLELMPMEEAVAPEEFAAAVPASAGMRLDSASESRLKVGIAAPLRHVVVLGASIGGPEAVRELLGALPRNFPALFVLAQHMGDEFLELMSAQLAKAVSMTVRTPTHGERVGHGEIVIVPTRQRMQIDGEGVITLSPLIERTPYSPSIDQVMRDVADEFGERAAAIVFSGMAQDAIDGSKYLTSRGGAVWVQDPQTCTISSMVDSVRQTGVVTFVGSPQQMAAKLIADFGAE